MRINKCELVQDTGKRALKGSSSRRSVLIICATVPNLLAQASKALTSPLRSPFKISHMLQEETESLGCLRELQPVWEICKTIAKCVFSRFILFVLPLAV